MKVCIEDFFSKYDQIRSFLNKSADKTLMENFVLDAVNSMERFYVFT